MTEQGSESEDEIMGEKQKKQEKQLHSGLLHQMIRMIILPVFLMMILCAVVISMAFFKQVEEEVRKELSYSAVMLDEMLSRLYPGELEKVTLSDGYYAICLGEHVLNEEDSEMLDELKTKTDIEYTYFYGTTRILTTMHDEDGKRYVESTVSDVISGKVIRENTDAFFSNAVIGSEDYYAYYMPVTDDGGQCIGMIGVAKPLHSVIRMREKTMLPVVLFILGAFACMIAIAIMYTGQLTAAIRKTERFLDKVAVGNLNTDMDRSVILRKDEIGSMARSSVSMQKAIRELVEKDTLTALHNRRYGEKQLKQIWEDMQKTGASYVLAIADIDFFKRINDTYGHEAGDMALREISGILKKEMCGKGDAVRWGGEEFLLIFEHIQLPEARKCLEEIRQIVERTCIVYHEEQMQVTMSFGVTGADADAAINLNLKQADDCLYRAKQEGRNRVIAYGMTEEADDL